MKSLVGQLRGESRCFRLLSMLPVLLAVGCAHSSDEIVAQTVPTATFDSYECDRIAAEHGRVSARLAELETEVDETAADDELMTTVGILVFPPLLFFLKGDGAEANEYGRPKGEHAALQDAAAQKQCPTINPA